MALSPLAELPALFRAYFPEFGSVDDIVVGREITAATIALDLGKFPAARHDDAVMLWTAHSLADMGFGDPADVEVQQARRRGVTSYKGGSVGGTFKTPQVGLRTTHYGERLLALARNAATGGLTPLGTSDAVASPEAIKGVPAGFAALTDENGDILTDSTGAMIIALA